MDESTIPLIVLGAGGHAKVLIEALRLAGRRVLFAVDVDAARHGQSVGGVPIRGDDDVVLAHPRGEVLLVHGLGSTRQCEDRGRLFDRMKQHGYGFARVLHPAAILSPSASLAEGAQILAGAVVQTDCVLEANVIVNTNASVDHDCRIGRHSHVGPGVAMSGGVCVGERTHIGVGATIVQGLTIGSGVLVAAGAVVVSDVPDGATVRGVPARITRKGRG
jgi:UDP-perosamine 4-acetyltransferase